MATAERKRLGARLGAAGSSGEADRNGEPGQRIAEAGRNASTCQGGGVPDVGSVLVGERRGSGMSLAIACSRFNGVITERLLYGALKGLAANGVTGPAVNVVWVPGAFELPLAASKLAESGDFSAVICLGAVIRGDTGHYEHVAGQCAAGILRAQLDTGVPVVFGVLTCDTVEQALERSGGGGVGDLGEDMEMNKGFEAAATALEMADLLTRLAAHGEARQFSGLPAETGIRP